MLGELWEEGYTNTQPIDWYIEPDIQHTGLIPKSSFFPTKSKEPYIETFSQAVYYDFKGICTISLNNPNKPPKNVTSIEYKALKDIESNNSIIVKIADKGGSIVVQDKDDYLKESYRLLSDCSTYTILKKDPLPEYQQTLKHLVSKAYDNGVLDQK